jgi:threonine dehydratase
VSWVPGFSDVLSAADQIKGLAVRTPLLSHPALNERAGGRLFIKAEPLQQTGSFKFRGAYNRISRLTPDERKGGVVAFSSGNHAQGVASAARMVGCPAVIVMPSDAPVIKIASTRAAGAEVILYDRYKDSREAIGAELAETRKAVLVPPFDDPFVIAGQGTVGLELFQDMAALGVTVDVVASNASGGGLMAGVALCAEALSPTTRIVVCEPAGFDDHALSLAAGQRTTFAPGGSTLCDALMSPLPGEITFPINQRLLSGAVSSSDDEVLDAMAAAFRYLKLVVEPGGAVSLACALQGRLKLNGGVGVVVASGGNVDPEVYKRALDLVRP